MSAIALACATATPVAAQHPAIGAPPPRPLHERLAHADAVAIARIEAIEAGRIHVADALAVLGAPPARFEIKRAASSPPGVAAGERVVLLLRGARSPYLWLDAPDERIRLDPRAGADAWVDALRALSSAQSTARGVAPVYAGWLARADAAGRREVARGLADARVDVSGVAPDVFAALAAMATAGEDPALSDPAARAAVRHPVGVERLLDELPGDDPRVLLTGLQAAQPADAERVTRILVQALRHEDALLREAALRASGGFATERSVRAQLVRVAAEDPDPALRELARRVMHATSSRASG